MCPIQRILVAIKDPTARPLPALAKATQLARACDAGLELFHALDSCVYLDMLGCSEDRALQVERDESAEYLQQLEGTAARLRLHTENVTVAAESDYPAYEAIVRHAEAIGADLIVAECHAGSHTAAALRQLVDWELVRSSPIPVLLVRLPQPYHRPTILAAVDPSHAFGKPPQLDEDVLGLGGVLSNALRGELHAVHAYLPRGAGELVWATAAGLSAAARSANQAKMRFDQLLEGANIVPARRHLIGGNPSAGVARLARRLRADIVVAGAMSRTGLQRLLMGNTAESLLNSLPCDLLVVKPAGFSSRIPTTTQGPRLVSVPPAW